MPTSPEHRRSPGIGRGVRLAGLLALIAAALVGCGGEPPPTSPSDMTEAVAIDYRSGTDDVQTRTVPLGEIVFLKVDSDVAGTVRVEGYDVGRPVAAGNHTVLVFSADHEGDFGVQLDTPGGSARVAELQVQ